MGRADTWLIWWELATVVHKLGRADHIPSWGSTEGLRWVILIVRGALPRRNLELQRDSLRSHIQTCVEQEPASCPNAAFWLGSHMLTGVTLGTDTGGS